MGNAGSEEGAPGIGRGRRRRAGFRWGPIVVALVAVGLHGPSAPAAAEAPTVPDELAARYLAHRPELGPVTVVDVSSESNDRRLLAATLQGIVNRSQARIYLVGARAAAEDAYWIDRYEADGLATVDARVGLDVALATFADEAAGYVVADPAEPWTIDTATTAAGALGAVVVTPATIAAAQSAGLTELEDHRGRWTDAASAYEATAEAHRDQLDSDSVALQQPDRHAPRDLFVQQGMFVAYTRPAQSDFDRVYDLLETFPARRPMYGYVSDTGDEEVQAVARLSAGDRYLIPTDTTSNLSFHLAVGGDQRARPVRRSAPVERCDPATTNVVVSFSDGDNLVVPEARYPSTANWLDPRRGTLPMGWGITPALAVLAPAMWDAYVGDATAADEVVDMMGLGYSYPTLMPSAANHLADGMRLRAALGIDVTWSLDALVSDPDAAGWTAIDAAARASDVPPAGMLLNYGRWPGPAWFHSSAGFPVIASQQTSYDATPTDIAEQIEALADDPDRPLVTFIAATVWNTSYAALVDALTPLRDAGVRFLTPSEAVACLPEPVVDPEPTTTTTTAPAVPTPPAPPAATPGAADPTYTG